MTAPRFIKHPLSRAGWTPWFQPNQKGYRQRCCDCGLVHEIEFRAVGGWVQYRARRARRITKEKA